MSADQRPAETAARQHREAAAALAVHQMTTGDGHSAAVMAGPYSVRDRTDTGLVQMNLPPVPDAASTHTGPRPVR